MLNSATLLSTWRLRWRKAMGLELQVPYSNGAFSSWLDRQRQAQFWQMPWPSRLAILSCVAFFALTPGVPLSLNAQILFAVLQLLFAVVLSRYAGPICALALVGLSVVTSTRYFYWRLTATLPLAGGEWVWGLLLWLTEVLVGLAWLLRMVEVHTPLLRTPEPLPKAAVSWPSVDVLLWCGDVDSPAQQAQLHARIQAVQQWDWPANKLHIHVAAPQALEGLPAQVRSHSTPKLDALLERPEWLASLGGEFLLVVESPSGNLPADVLHGCLASLVQSLGLAYVCTPHSSSAPPAWAAAPLQWPTDVPPMMLARRTALQALATGAQTWTVAGLVPPGTRVAEETQTTSRWMLCNAAARRFGLASRLRARALLQGLSFYAPLAWGVVWATPLLALGLGWAPVRSSWAELLVYGLPHVFLANLASRAQDRAGRLPTQRLLHEGLLQAALLWRTARAFVFTQLRYWGQPLWPRWVPRFPDPALSPVLWWREGLVLALHVIVLIPLLRELPSWSEWRGSLLGLYTVWALYNVCTSLSRLAVAKEAALVEEETARRSEQTALITLEARRVLRATTLNFPNAHLTLRLERAAEWVPELGRTLTVSVLHRGVAHSFSAQLRAGDAASAEVIIEPAELPDYEAFGAAVFSREADWPKWLAGRRADQLLPDWMHRLYKTVESVFYDFVIARKGLQSLVHRLQAWIRPGSPDHG